MNDAKAAQRKNVCDSSYDFSLVQHRCESTGGLLQMLMKHFKFVVQRVSIRTVTTALKVICKSASVSTEQGRRDLCSEASRPQCLRARAHTRAHREL